MISHVKVPQIVEGQDIIKLVTWYVKDGDYVKEGAALCLLETSKASFELPAEKAGYTKILKKEGDVVLANETICMISDSLEELPK